ncbi:MAG: phytanoyl-CoA dioxygenase family protein [Spirochaetota bacterium]
MALVKPPGGREKPWHQDHACFDLPLDSTIVGVWIALGHATGRSATPTSTARSRSR